MRRRFLSENHVDTCGRLRELGGPSRGASLTSHVQHLTVRDGGEPARIQTCRSVFAVRFGENAAHCRCGCTPPTAQCRRNPKAKSGHKIAHHHKHTRARRWGGSYKWQREDDIRKSYTATLPGCYPPKGGVTPTPRVNPVSQSRKPEKRGKPIRTLGLRRFQAIRPTRLGEMFSSPATRLPKFQRRTSASSSSTALGCRPLQGLPQALAWGVHRRHARLPLTAHSPVLLLAALRCALWPLCVRYQPAQPATSLRDCSTARAMPGHRMNRILFMNNERKSENINIFIFMRDQALCIHYS